MHPIDYIKTFTRMTPELEANLNNIMHQGTFKKGATIRGAVNLSNYAYYICSGAARIYIITGGKEHTLSFTFEDEFILPSKQSIRHQPDTITIQFLENTKVIYVPHLKVKDLLSGTTTVDDISALLFLNAALLRYNEFLEERLYTMQTLNATERYKWLITRYPRILETATITQISSYLGLTKETLYRIRNNNY